MAEQLVKQRETGADEQVWDPVIAQICEKPGLVLVIGGSDAGKSYGARRLAESAARAGISAALIDADPGQVEVGLPLCIGMERIEPDDREAARVLAFVGATTPIHHIPEFLAALSHIANEAKDCSLRAVDMPCAISGVSARRLHHSAFELLVPTHIVAVSHGTELNGIIAPIRRRAGVTTHTVHAASVETGPIREQRRTMRLAAYFRDASAFAFPFTSLAFAGTWLGAGEPVPPHMFKYLATALTDYTRVYYSEQYGSHLGVMVSKPVPPACPALAIALEQFRAQEVTVTRAPLLKNLVVGLEAESGKLLGLGRITAIDFKRRTVGITTPIRSPGAVVTIRFGGIHVGEDGRQIRPVFPGEI